MSDADIVDRLCLAPHPCLAFPAETPAVFVPLRALEDAETFWSLLDGEDSARAAAIRHCGRALAFRAGRVVARLLLSRLSGERVAPKSWRIVPDERGRPRVFPRGPAISITHTTEMLGVAATAAGRIGLDMEPLGVAPVAIPVGELSPAERQRLASLASALRGDAFLRLWTVKEAVAKCLGAGVSADFAGIDASGMPDGDGVARIGGCDVITRVAALAGVPYSISLARAAESGDAATKSQ